MQKLKDIFGLNKKNELNKDSNNNLVKYNQQDVDGFIVYSENQSIKNDNNNNKEYKDFINNINPKELKDANFYKKIWENIEEFEELKEARTLFEELWKNIYKIINNNIIDFTCKYINIYNSIF
jgi:hypothetical protein